MPDSNTLRLTETGIDDEPEEGRDPYSDPDLEDISSRIDKVISTDKFARSLFQRDWFRNILMDVGAQWIIYKKGRWQQKELPDWFPRAQTNKFAEKKKDLVGQFVNGEPIPITYLPATDDPESDATAEVGDRLREVIHAEAQTDSLKSEIANWIADTGNCYAIPYYDMDKSHGQVEVPLHSCPECGDNQIDAESLAKSDGDCPTCGAPGDSLTESTDEDGNPLVEQMPIGALQLDIVSPFEIRGDYRIADHRKWRRFVRVKRYDLDYAREHWGDVPDMAGNPMKDRIIADNQSDETSQYYMDIISHLTSNFTIGTGTLGEGSNTKNPKVTAYIIYELPSKKYPEGLRAVRLGRTSETTVEIGPLPDEYGAGVKKGQKFLPLIHWIFDTIPGRHYGKTPLDDVVPLQLFRNIVEAHIRLTVQRMGNSVWLNPKGSGVDIFSGEPGQVHTYNPVSMGGTNFAKPERLPADLSGLMGLIGLLRLIDDEIERVSGTFFLQGGTAPPGVTAASALAYLGEKGQQSFSTPMVNWVSGWLEFEKYSLEIVRKNWTEARIRRVLGKNKKWQTEKFSQADIQGAVDMVVDYKAAFAKSSATEQAKIGSLVQMGIVNPQDTEMALEVLKKFGMMSLKESVDEDITYAAKMLDKFLATGPDPDDEDVENWQPYIPTVRPLIDNSSVLFAEAVKFAKTDEYDELEPERQEVWLTYCKALAADIAARRVALTQTGLDPDVPALAEVPSGEATIAAIQGAQLEQQASQMGGAGGPGAPGGQPGGPPMPDVGASAVPPPSGIPSALDQAMGGNASKIKPEGSPRSIPILGGQ